MLNEEVAKYRELSGDTNPNTPISRIGGYLDGYEKALEQEPCEDAISREDVLMCLTGEIKETDTIETIIARFVRRIRKLPPVNPQPKTGRWILVSERLPEDSELVLFSTKTDRVFEGRYFADNTDRQWYSFRDETFAWNNVVIAWMPLPKPYEPQERSEKE